MINNVECETCKKGLYRNNSQLKASKTGLFFCGRECKSKWHSIEFEDMKKTITCENCNVQFKKVNSSEQKYCSRKCKGEFKSKQGTSKVNCKNCNKEFLLINFSVRENNLCSVKCRSDWNSAKNKKVELKCNICNQKYIVSNNRKNTSKTCSKDCHYKYIQHLSLNTELNEKLRQNGIKVTSNIKKKDTLPEIMMEQYLKSENIKFEKQKPMYGKFVVDFYLTELDIVLEVYGDYWHANPEIYSVEKGNLQDFQIGKVDKDKARKKFIENKGHRFIFMWENEIHKDITKLKTLISN